MGATNTSSKAMATALATGQSRLLKNSVHNTLPIINDSGGPNSAGITYSPTAGMNTNMQPARMPGHDNGTVMCMKALNGRHPKSAAASNNVRSIFSKLAYSGMIMNGR